MIQASSTSSSRNYAPRCLPGLGSRSGHRRPERVRIRLPRRSTISVSPDSLWPANHKYVDVTATVVVSDNFGPNPTITLVSVTSNEPDNGQGDGDKADDIVIVDNFHFKLRAERSGGGDGRIYTITYTVTDACGNSTTQSVTVTVAHDKGKKQQVQAVRTSWQLAEKFRIALQTD